MNNFIKRSYRLILLLLSLTIGSYGCSMGQVVVRGSAPIMDGGLVAMNQETDLELAHSAIPATIKMMEGMLEADPDNIDVRIYVAQAFYGYAFGFVEMQNFKRAARLYQRGLKHASIALRLSGLDVDIYNTSLEELRSSLDKLDESAIPALFWTASCWAKWSDMSRDKPEAIAQITRAAKLMRRVVELNEDYYYGGPNLFFAIYYGARAPMFGGNFELSEQYFERAKKTTQGRLLIVDVFYAEYLARQKLDKQAFHNRLMAVINTPQGYFPEMALANQIARERAHKLLQYEEEWF
ncbi:MAG: hypothetical protein GXP22_02005 [Gammaproteobacteria bacterium]|nr:hypothetical protein [Gammaproteobacteria bacterium]